MEMWRAQGRGGERDLGELQRKKAHFFPFREGAGSSSRGWAGALGVSPPASPSQTSQPSWWC